MSIDWESVSNLKTPLGIITAAVGAIVSAYLFLDSTYVHAENFKEYQKTQTEQIKELQKTIELQNLNREKSMLEREIIKLEAKRETNPTKFDPVDKVFLERLKGDVQEIKQDIKALKSK